jgi:Tfp pilus assembly protein PilE
MAEAAVIASAVAAAASTGYSVYSGERQADMAKAAAQKQEAFQTQSIAREEERAAQEKNAQAQAFQVDASRRRARLLALQNSGRVGQVLSGAQGSGYTGGTSTTLGAY